VIISRFRLIAIAALMIVAALVSGCDTGGTTAATSNPTPTTASTGGAASAATPTPSTSASSTGNSGNSGNASDGGAVKVASIDSIKSYHLTLTSKSSAAGTDTTSTVEGDFIRPDKAKMSVTAAGTKISYIIIGDDTYMSMDGQNYTKGSGGKAIADGYTSLLTSSTQSVASYSGMKNVGSESIGGEDCTHYSYDGSAAGASGKVDLWIAKSDNTVRKWQSSGSTNGMSADTSFTISNVNKVSDITAP
jgi:outer membrane lipoprotein-sorting protein